jgi:hypothetical protein
MKMPSELLRECMAAGPTLDRVQVAMGACAVVCWVGVRLDTLKEWKRLQLLVRDAYVHVATKTLQKRLASGSI